MINTISQSFDIWTTAQTPKSKGRGRSTNNINHYGIQKLRELILELAVRGKLVPQDPSDEPATELLKRIALEKERLIEEGKIKKQDTLPEITDDERTFLLPKNWILIRLGEVSEFVNGYSFKSGDFSDAGIGIVKIGDIQNGNITTDFMSRVPIDIINNLDDSYKVFKNDLVIAMSGATTGKLGFNKTDEIFYLNQRVGKILPFIIDFDFLFHALTTKISENLAKSMGSAIPNLSTVQIKNTLLALPPLTEQHRIVAKVDELMSLCDKLEQEQNDNAQTHETLVNALLGALTNIKDSPELQDNWQRIEDNFDILFTTEQSIDKLKQTILQLAVMGKLVPQDPNDEPASELLKRIALEKERLIEEGKIKKQDPFPEITDDEKPFDLPNGWEFVRLGQIIKISSGEGLTAFEMTKSGTIPVFGGNGINGYHDQGNVFKPTLVIGRVGYYCGSVHITPPLAWITDNAFITYFSDINIFLEFLYWLLRGTNLKENESATAQPVISGKKIYPIIVALPPYNEQLRIVSKIDELFSICDNIKAKINASEELKIHLADAVVERGIE